MIPPIVVNRIEGLSPSGINDLAERSGRYRKDRSGAPRNEDKQSVTPSRSDKIANLANPVEWKRDTPYFAGKMLKYDDLARRLYQSQLRIAELERVMGHELRQARTMRGTP